MKIDIFSHFLPKQYLAAVQQRALPGAEPFRINAPLCDVDSRLRVVGKYPGLVQVLTVATPPLDTMVAPEDAVDLAMIANDELAELVAKYPDRFVAVATLPLTDIDAALEETDRAITKLGFRGVQIFSNINGEQLDSPQFRPLYELMARHDLPIWIHPWFREGLHDPVLGWPFETTWAMMRLAGSGVFDDYPNIKFITHHCGALVPFFSGRIFWLGFDDPSARWIRRDRPVKESFDHLRKFYNDTAMYGECTASLMCGYSFFGSDRLLFGTDAPLGGDGAPEGHTDITIQSIEQMDVSEQDKAKIFGGNARKLLRL